MIAPIAMGRRIITGIIIRDTEPPDTFLAIKAFTVKNTPMPTISSNTAMGSNVSITGLLCEIR